MDKPPKMSPVKLNLTNSFARATKDVFTKNLDLLPKQKAEKIRAKCRRSIDVECEELDVSEPQTPISPTSPWTPKSLISQLSREDSFSGSKKRLSYSESIDNDDKESVISGCSDDSDDRPTNRGKSLLTIDVSSLLGQRIQRHVKNDSAVKIVQNSENFCRTPIKNQFFEKLRNRTVSYPVAYKPRRKAMSRYCHKVSFTSKQKKERKKILQTGLNRSGRALLKEVKPCKVLLARLTDKEMKRFMGKRWHAEKKKQKKLVSTENSVFPKEPLLLSKEIDQLLGLKKRSDLNKNELSPLSSLAAVVSEDANAEASRNKLTLYRCLLHEVGDSKKPSSKLKGTLKKSGDKTKEDEMKSETINTPFSTPCSTPMLPLSPVSPPESLVDYKLERMSRINASDDNISIISIESDEESLKSGCCLGCRSKKHCLHTPEGNENSSYDNGSRSCCPLMMH